jgi:hypothetical protein
LGAPWIDFVEFEKMPANAIRTIRATKLVKDNRLAYSKCSSLALKLSPFHLLAKGAICTVVAMSLPIVHVNK